MVSLWDFLTLVCCVMPIGGALAAAGIAKVGFRGYALAITVGLALGVGCGWTMWTVANRVVARMKRGLGPKKERFFSVLYLAAMLWIVFALFLGEWVSSLLLRSAF